MHCFLFLFSRTEWFISIAANGALGLLVYREAPEFFFTLLSFDFLRVSSPPLLFASKSWVFFLFPFSKWFSGVRA